MYKGNVSQPFLVPSGPGGPASAFAAVCDPHCQPLKNQRSISYLFNLRLFQKLVSAIGGFIYFFIARKTLVAPGKIKE
jgi:hypothetical protein